MFPPSQSQLDLENDNPIVNEAKWRLAAIVESSEDAIISKGLDGVIITWNDGALRLFGYSPEEAIGRPITILIPPDRHSEETEILGRIRKGNRIDHYQTVRRRKDGVLVEVSLTVSPIKDSTGKIIGASKIARDITQLKIHETALKAAKEEAERANALKDRFLAMISHELRMPLTPVLMAASALEIDPTLPDFVREDMAMIRRNIEVETKLIDDLLDLSRIKSGKLNLQIEAVDINEIVRRACDVCQQQIEEKSLRLICDFDQSSGVNHIQADPTRLQQIFWNLLKNAAKFTSAGGDIAIRTWRCGGKWRVEIRDTGIGIEPELFPRLFTAFEQGNSNGNEHSGGLGLGLAISKALAELHNGSIQAESLGRGKGSVFTVRLPE